MTRERHTAPAYRTPHTAHDAYELLLILSGHELRPRRVLLFFRIMCLLPGAAAALAKVTGVIVTVRVALRRAGGAEHPPI